MTALADFREAWVFTLIAILIWIASAALLSVPTLNGLMKVGVWTLMAFGFSTSTLAFVASAIAWRAGWRKLKTAPESDDQNGAA